MKLIMCGLTAALVAVGSLASAQTEKPKTTPPQTPAPAQKEKPAPVVATQETQVWRLSDIKDLNLTDEAKATIGEVDDLLIDTSDGRIVYALIGKGGVMGIGEDSHIVPWESVRVESKDMKAIGCCTLTEAQIESAPVYRKTDVLTPDMEAKIRQNVGLKEAGAPRTAGAGLVAASQVKGADVRGADNTELGEIEDLVIAPKEGAVAYMIFAAGGVLGMGEKHYALPWSTSKVMIDKEQKLVITAPLDKERLAKAPEFDKKDWKKMSSMPWMKDMYGFWGVEPYWSRSVKASSKIGG